ncbi:hypothetical protein MHYP_G00126800 [Metynnis hypsauchen]
MKQRGGLKNGPFTLEKANQMDAQAQGPQVTKQSLIGSPLVSGSLSPVPCGVGIGREGWKLVCVCGIPFRLRRLQVTSTPPHFETDPWWQLLGERSDVSIRLSKEIARGSGGSPGANQTLHAAPTRCSFTGGGVELKKEKGG